MVLLILGHNRLNSYCIQFWNSLQNLINQHHQTISVPHHIETSQLTGFYIMGNISR